MPDLIILDKCAYNQAIVKEANKLQIPIIGICDTNTPFNILSKIQMPIIMNDDSDNATRYVIETLLHNKC